MRVLIYGLGRSGSAAARLCHDQGHQLSFYELRAQGSDIEELLAVGATRIYDVSGSDADICIAAPGVRIDHPDLARLRADGVATIGEVEWVYRTVGGPSIGVTGTAGKGTTTRWIYDMLRAGGHDAVIGGNFDPALAAVARPGATAVIEFSSFQLERCPSFRPDVAVVLNLGSDHLDRHGTVARYHQTKRALIARLRATDLFVYNADDPTASAWAAQTPARTAGFSLTSAAAAWYRSADDALIVAERSIVHGADLALPGRHNVANGLAAALVARERGVGFDTIAGSLRSYQGLPGRYALAGNIGAMRFIDDSIATRPLAVAAALAATPAPVVWIAGGVDKGAEVEALEDQVRGKVTLMVGIGAAGSDFANRAGDWVATATCPHSSGRDALRCAVERAVEHLQRHHDGRGTVLLAPLAASFDQFEDYAQRGSVFRDVVKECGAAWTPC